MPLARALEPPIVQQFLEINPVPVQHVPDQADMLGTLVMWGYGIKPGTNLGKVQSLDVAPTMAELLGVKLPSAEGKALKKALK